MAGGWETGESARRCDQRDGEKQVIQNSIQPLKDSAFNGSHWEALRGESYDLIYVNFKNHSLLCVKWILEKQKQSGPAMK